MKRNLVLLLVLFIFYANVLFAQNSGSLDDSIIAAARYLNETITAGTYVAVFNFSSDSEKLSKYITEELTIALINTRMNLFDRNNLDEVNREIYYGFTGAVNDDTAQSYGKDIGVSTVILGSMVKSGSVEYRLRVQAIVVETKRIQAGKTYNIKPDERLLSLLDIRILNEYRFTTKEKTTAGIKNMFFGAGSFKMGDPLGGGITLALETVSFGFIIYGAIDSSAGFRWNKNYRYNDWSDLNKERKENRDKYYNECMGIIIGGSIGMTLSWTWGFIRPFMYDRPVAVQKIANVLDHVNIGVIPMNNGETKVSFLLTTKL